MEAAEKTKVADDIFVAAAAVIACGEVEEGGRTMPAQRWASDQAGARGGSRRGGEVRSARMGAELSPNPLSFTQQGDQMEGSGADRLTVGQAISSAV